VALHQSCNGAAVAAQRAQRSPGTDIALRPLRASGV
jgi:hypothetical protein